MNLVAALVLALLFVPASAQIRPLPGPGDPRLQTVRYDPDQVVRLTVAPDYQLTLVFDPGEAVETVAIGDSTGWQAMPSKRGDSLFVKAGALAQATNMSVVTSARRYMFELVPAVGSSSETPYRVAFAYDETPPPLQALVVATTGRYRLTGRRALQPSAMSDDGQRTYIEWASEQTLPAVFAIDDAGQELLVDGHMRDGRYTIDAIRDRYVFRLGREVARAARIRGKAR